MFLACSQAIFLLASRYYLFLLRDADLIFVITRISILTSVFIFLFSNSFFQIPSIGPHFLVLFSSHRLEFYCSDTFACIVWNILIVLRVLHVWSVSFFFFFCLFLLVVNFLHVSLKNNVVRILSNSHISLVWSCLQMDWRD